MAVLLFVLMIFAAGCGNSEQQPENEEKSVPAGEPVSGTLPEHPPNIILILADDMGYGDPGSYNPDSKIPTPNIDRLADEGIRFTDAHSAGNWCVPSRFGLLTGRYPFRTELNWREESVIDSSRTTLASLLRERGYRTGMVGKWHQGFENMESWHESGYRTPLRGGPIDRGFDYFYGIPASLDIPPYYFIENDRAVKPPTDSIAAGSSEDATTPIQGAFWRAGKSAPGFRHSGVLPVIREKARTFILKSYRNPDKRPFFLYVAMTAPHTPWLPLERFEGTSEAGRYGDFVAQTDGVVGRIMDMVDRLDIREETLILFTSDNGPVWFEPDVDKFGHRSTGPLRGMKADTWEGGHRVPFIVRWPGTIPAGRTSNALVGFTDLMATFDALTGEGGAGPDRHADSYNLVPVLLGKRPSAREVLPVDERTIRQGPWKLILGSGMGGLHRRYAPGAGNSSGGQETDGELYNLEVDLSERNNLYREQPERVREMKQLLEKIQNGSPESR